MTGWDKKAQTTQKYRFPVSSCSGTGKRFLKCQGLVAEGGDGLAVGDKDHSLGGIGLEEAAI